VCVDIVEKALTVGSNVGNVLAAREESVTSVGYY